MRLLLDAGPVEAVVAELALCGTAIAGVTAGLPAEVSVLPLIGIAWVGTRARDRQLREREEGSESPQQPARADGGTDTANHSEPAEDHSAARGASAAEVETAVEGVNR